MNSFKTVSGVLTLPLYHEHEKTHLNPIDLSEVWKYLTWRRKCVTRRVVLLSLMWKKKVVHVNHTAMRALMFVFRGSAFYCISWESLTSVEFMEKKREFRLRRRHSAEHPRHPKTR